MLCKFINLLCSVTEAISIYIILYNDINNDNYIKVIIKKNFPYINYLINNNICVAGGFLRSIILNQTVNDIDFFIYGYVENYFVLIDNFIKIITNYFKSKFIIHLYKPQNKVLEIIITSCFDIIIKIQLILVNNEDIDSLLSSFDMNPCKIAYNGVEIIRKNECIDAYKYLINDIRDIDINKCINLDYRIKKYLNYGFDLIIEKNELKIKLNTVIKISNNLMANIININENIIEIDLINNNYLENKEESNSKIEPYYTTFSIGSTEICSLIDIKKIYSYIEIKGINILFYIISTSYNLYMDNDGYKEKFINNIIDKSNIDK